MVSVLTFLTNLGLSLYFDCRVVDAIVASVSKELVEGVRKLRTYILEFRPPTFSSKGLSLH